MIVYTGIVISVKKKKTAVGAEALVHYYTSLNLFTVWGAYFSLGVISIPYRLQDSLMAVIIDCNNVMPMLILVS